MIKIHLSQKNHLRWMQHWVWAIPNIGYGMGWKTPGVVKHQHQYGANDDDNICNNNYDDYPLHLHLYQAQVKDQNDRLWLFVDN